ncbi:MAG: FKBP-type peptidyl-prolyl cis-trans isomerase [Desulfobacterales bacterium]|nr:FKBP-type peptidyl-prolyl cis-trans isomerase [Desulfobacterales bacterium]
MAQGAVKYPKASALSLTQGIFYEILVPGEGEEIKADQKASVHFTGQLDDGKPLFDTREQSKPVSFTLGAREIIPGLDLGVLGMKKGEKRRLIVAYPLAFGAAGYPGMVPPRSTIIFEVELMDFQ